MRACITSAYMSSIVAYCGARMLPQRRSRSHGPASKVGSMRFPQRESTTSPSHDGDRIETRTATVKIPGRLGGTK